MTDRRAAETVGLHPDSAAYTKSRPPVHAYMQEHQAAVQQELVEQGADPSRLPRLAMGRAVDLSRRAAEDPHPFNPSRDQFLARLWEIANMNPEITRGSLAGHVKALSMIVAIEGLIPDRLAASAQTKSAPPPVTADIYQAEWLRNQRSGENAEPLPTPAQEETASEPSSAHDSPPPTAEHTPTPASAVSQHRAAPENGTQTPSLAPRVPMADHFAPDTRVPFSIKKNPSARRR
jgi:hypothetical protein